MSFAQLPCPASGACIIVNSGPLRVGELVAHERTPYELGKAHGQRTCFGMTAGYYRMSNAFGCALSEFSGALYRGVLSSLAPRMEDRLTRTWGVDNRIVWCAVARQLHVSLSHAAHVRGPAAPWTEQCAVNYLRVIGSGDCSVACLTPSRGLAVDPSTQSL